MKLYEFEAKEVFKKYGIPVPEGKVITSPEEISGIDYPVVVKSQVLAGGRGKAGGIKFAESEEEAKQIAGELLGAKLKDLEIKHLLIEKKMSIANEYYLGVTIDRTARSVVVIASASGGMNIEEVAAQTPEKVIKVKVDPRTGLQPEKAEEIAGKMGLAGEKMKAVASILEKLYNLFCEMDGELTEINPMIETTDGEFWAVDARLNIDDSSIYRHSEYTEKSEREMTDLEARAKEHGLAYIDLDGDIGIIGNGAGLVMATLDSVKLHGGSPANFCDLGGGADKDRVVEGIDIILSKPNVKGVFINVLAGITKCDDVAAGLVEYRDSKGIQVPIVMRLVGTNEEAGQKICEEAGIDLLPTMDQAADRIVQLVSGAGSAPGGA